MTPPRLTLIIFSPGLMPVLSRTATGMTTWNLGNTVTTLDFMSITLSSNQSKIDSDKNGHVLKTKSCITVTFATNLLIFSNTQWSRKQSSLKLI